MPGELQPLANNFRIVNEDGTPTEYFIRWAQERQIDIQGGITAEQAQELINEWAATRSIIAGTGLSGGGTLDQDRTISLDAVLDDLNDVDTSTTPPTDGQGLGYDEPSGLWVPMDFAGGGGGSTNGWAFAGFNVDNFTATTAVATGNYANDPNNSLGLSPVNNFYWTNGGSGQTLTFNFLAPVVISGIGIFSDRTGSSQGFWQIAGSNDNVSFTNIGTPVEWTGAIERAMVFANATAYQYYKMTHVSGSNPGDSQYQNLFIFRWAIGAGGGSGGGVVPPTLSTFSIDIGAAKTVSDTPTGGIMIVATTNASGLQARLKSATAPFTFVAGLRGNTQANFNGIGIVVRDTAGKYVFLADLAETSLEMSNWSNAATFSSSPFSATWTSTPLYFRVVVDASNDVQWSVSQTRNGPWYNLSTPNTYLGTVDAVGFAVNRNNASFAPVAWFFDYEQS